MPGIIQIGLPSAGRSMGRRPSPLSGNSLEIPGKCSKSRFLQENACSAAFTAAPVALRGSFGLPQKEAKLRTGNILYCGDWAPIRLDNYTLKLNNDHVLRNHS